MNKTEYKNRYYSEHYDRIIVSVPKGFKEQVKNLASENNVSVNEYIYRLICSDLDQSGHSRTAQQNILGQDQKDILKKMQVASKYYEMIDSVVVDDAGYHIQLKQGCINDVTGNRTLQTVTMKQMRDLITKTHKVRTEELIEGLDAVTVEQLQKWQIPRKYYRMIDSIQTTKTEGHTINLKDGFINDHTGSSVIHVDKTNVFKAIMKYTHELTQA